MRIDWWDIAAGLLIHRVQHDTLEIKSFRHGEKDWMIAALSAFLDDLHPASGVTGRLMEDCQEHFFVDVIRA